MSARSLQDFLADYFLCKKLSRGVLSSCSFGDFKYYRDAAQWPQGSALSLPHRWRWKLDRWREKLAAMFHSEPQQPRPKLCPACGTLVGSSATRCHQCGASMTYSLAALSKSFGRFMPANAPATYLILSSCCLIYGISLLLTLRAGHMPGFSGGLLGTLMNIGGVNGTVLFRLGASVPALTMNSLPLNIYQPWRLVTACFLHANLLHIFFNMWVLVDLGPSVEELYGSSRFFFIYTVCGIGGYLLSGFMGHLSIGASGAIVGLIGVLLAITYRRRTSGMQMLRAQIWRWIIYLVIWGFLFQAVDNWTHLGGGITGFILGKIMLDRAPIDMTERKRAYALGWLAGIAVIASFVFMILNFRRPLPF
jgi:rhomboid protease GluP